MSSIHFKCVIYFVFSISSSLYACEVAQEVVAERSVIKSNKILNLLTGKILYDGQSSIARYQIKKGLCQHDMRYVVGLLSFFTACTHHISDSALRIPFALGTALCFAVLVSQIKYLKDVKGYEKNAIRDCVEKLSLDSVRALNADQNIKRKMGIDDHFIDRILNEQYQQGKNVLDAIGAVSCTGRRRNTTLALTLGQLLADEKGFLEACNSEEL